LEDLCPYVSFEVRERANAFQIAVYGFLISRGPKLLVANFVLDASAASLVPALALARDERRPFRLKGITRADAECLFFKVVPITTADKKTNAMSNITHPAMLTTRITASDSTKLKSAECIGGQRSVRFCFKICRVNIVCFRKDQHAVLPLKASLCAWSRAIFLPIKKRATFAAAALKRKNIH
jgi:hypothetical protein